MQVSVLVNMKKHARASKFAIKETLKYLNSVFVNYRNWSIGNILSCRFMSGIGKFEAKSIILCKFVIV